MTTEKLTKEKHQLPIELTAPPVAK